MPTPTPEQRYLSFAAADMVAGRLKVIMRISELRQQLAAANPLRQARCGIPSCLGGALDLQYLPDRDRKAQNGDGCRSPCQDPEDGRVGG
jgi:hypothetical protein